MRVDDAFVELLDSMRGVWIIGEVPFDCGGKFIGETSMIFLVEGLQSIALRDVE